MKTRTQWVPFFMMLVGLAIAGACGDDDVPDLNPAEPGTAPAPAPASTPSASPSVQPGQSVAVSIPQNSVGLGAAAYGVNPLVVVVGTTVTWTNDDSVPHTATANDGSFDSGTLAPGESFSHSFDTPGTFAYFCTIHGQASMNGTVEVTTASPTPSPSPSASPSPSPSASPSPSPSASPSPSPSASPSPSPSASPSVSASPEITLPAVS